jgi:hypothetical protein
MTTQVSTRLLVEIEQVLGELVGDTRAGWGDEPYIECLYCGEHDYDPGDQRILRAHHKDCPVSRGRTLRGMLKGVLEVE